MARDDSTDRVDELVDWAVSDTPATRDRQSKAAEYNESLEKLEERVKLAGLTSERIGELSGPSNLPYFLRIQLPRGNGSQGVLVSQDDWSSDLDIERFRFVEDYEAIVDVKSGVIWAALINSANGLPVQPEQISSIPGAVKAEESELPEWSKRRRMKKTAYRLRVEGPTATLEITPHAPYWLAHSVAILPYRTPYFLRIEHRDGPAGPRAREQLNGIARDFLFDLDIVRNLNIGLMLYRVNSAPKFSFDLHNSEVRYPRIAYAPQAHALYWYAASAGQFPLSQFLAYYQIIEFFFSSFNREAVIKNVRRHMKNPAFAASNDFQMNKLIDLTKDAHRGVKGEKSQLLVALRSCISEDDLRKILSQDSMKSELCAKRQKIKGVEALRLGESEDVFDQVASRIYSIRCRIVHTKESADGTEFDLLLPNDEESGNLGADIQLIKILAQHAMVHGGQER